MKRVGIIIPFYTIWNEELSQTNQDETIKSKTITKKKSSSNQDLRDTLNNAFGKPETEILSN